MLSTDDIACEPRSRTPSWTTRKIDGMLHDLRDNIRRLSTTVQPGALCEPGTSSSLLMAANGREEAAVMAKRKTTSQREEDAKEAETLRLILEAQYVALMDQALPIIEKLKAAKDGGFFTSLWAIIKGASGKTDRVKQLMERAEGEAKKMRRKWERAEEMASGLSSGKYAEMVEEARGKAALQNARIDGKMAELRRRID